MDEFILTRGQLVAPLSVDRCYPRVMIDAQGVSERESVHADGCMRACFYEDGDRKPFRPVDVRIDTVDGSPFWWCVRGEVRSPVASHAAFDEVLTLTFRSSLLNGTHAVGAPPGADVMLIYRLMFRDPPAYPGRDVYVVAGATSGTVTLGNDPGNYPMAGAFGEAIIQVPALYPLVGTGPRWPYDLCIKGGYFEVMRP